MGSALRRNSCWLVAALLVGACGGSGGDGSQAGLLSGTYHFVGVDAHTNVTGVVQTQWGTITANGAGSLDSSTVQNHDTVVSGPDTQTGVPYTIAPDRTLTVLDPTMPGTVLAVGRVASSGAIAALGTLTDGQSPGLYLALRRSGTFSTGSLDGDYAMCVFRHEGVGDLNAGDTGGVTFDGMGNAPGGVTINRNGAISGAGFSATYTVASNGAFSLTFSPTNNYRGGILEGTSVIVAAGSTTNGNDPDLFVFVRNTTGATDGLLSGSYFLTGIQYAVGDGEYRSVTGTFVADGSGGYTAQTQENAEGVISGPSPSAGTYAVAPDGGLLVTAPDATLEGAVSPGGSFAVVSGGTTAGDNPMLFVLLK